MKPKFKNAQQLKAEEASTDAIAAEAKLVFAAMTMIMNTVEREDRSMTADEKREYDALENIYDGIADLREMQVVDRRGVVAPENRHEDYREGQPLAADQTYVGAMRALNRVPSIQDETALSFGKYLRGAMTGRWDDASDEMQVFNALSGGSSTAGGILIPEILTGQIVDLARARTRVIQAGARVVPMANRKVTVPKWLSDPVPDWRAENSAFAEDDATLGSVDLEAKGLGVFTKVSLELLEDTDIQGELEHSFAKSFSQILDLSALYSTGDPDVDGNPTPTGVKSTSGVAVTPLAADGEAPTWAALVDSVGRVRDANEEPNAQIMSDRTLRTLSLLPASDGSYIQPPSYLDDITRYTTSQVPNDLTVGTATTTSDLFTGDWSKLLIGVRSELRIFVLKERFLPDSGQIGFVAHWRGDFAVTRPAAFDVVTGVMP